MTYHKTAVFGSAFNPPHMGHADVIDQALEHFDTVVLVPSFVHAFGKAMAPYDLRLEMVKELVRHCAWGSRVIVSAVEEALAAPKPPHEAIYTYDVLLALEAEQPHLDLTFVVGPDNAKKETWQKFFKANEIDRRWGLWCALERKAIRSTLIRSGIKTNEKIADDVCPAGIVKAYTNYFFEIKGT